jgi:phage gpG-like protein
MAITVTVSVAGARGFVTRIDRWTINLKNMNPAYNAIANYQASEWKKQFASQGSQFGTPWAPLSPKYRAWKAAHFPGQPILVRTGRLRTSLTQRPLGIEEVSTKGLRLGTDVPYAQWHQRGTRVMPRRQLYSNKADATRARTISKIMQTYITTGRVN